MTERDLALPRGYNDLLAERKNRVREARVQALHTVDTELIGHSSARYTASAA